VADIRKGEIMDAQIVQFYFIGASFGSALAMSISFNVNKSVAWAIIHGLFSWFYVIYYVLFKSK
jgi:hypothetical protein